jgi:hypothetical protein
MRAYETVNRIYYELRAFCSITFHGHISEVNNCRLDPLNTEDTTGIEETSFRYLGSGTAQNLCRQALRCYADWVNLKKRSLEANLDPLPSVEFFLGARILAFSHSRIHFSCSEMINFYFYKFIFVAIFQAAMV